MVRPDGTPLSGASVSALSPTGEVGVQRLAQGDGQYRLPLPSAGTWRVRVAHIGFATQERMVEVAVGEDVDLRFEMEEQALRLPGVDVEVAGRCRTRDRQEEVPDLWTQARAIFAARGPAAVRLETERALRQYAAWAQIVSERGYEQARDNEHILRAVDTLWIEGPHILGNPNLETSPRDFILPLIPDQTESYLYDYRVPEPAVLLSDEFLASHCFFLRNHPDGEAWIGLAFEPLAGSGIEYDVRGTFWIPVQEGREPRIDFSFTRLPRQDQFYELVVRGRTYQGYVEASVAGRTPGHLELTFVPDVGWVTSRAVLRIPWVTRESLQIFNAGVRAAIRNGADLRSIPDLGRPPLRRVWVLQGFDEHDVRVIRMQVNANGR
ncbi:MAG: carboxypeptidase regulatory-like domain-containing protein [Gemmatimonadetes bacterium]|nr:carboxypeptidase regulatory-like domain-containing protein [Gemmatimonadota bacterium]